MDFTTIVGIVFGLAFVILLLIRPRACKHEKMTYYEAEGDKLPGDQTEACFCRCEACGKTFVIPSGFQSDAHFENYLLYGGGPKRQIGKDRDE